MVSLPFNPEDDELPEDFFDLEGLEDDALAELEAMQQPFSETSFEEMQRKLPVYLFMSKKEKRKYFAKFNKDYQKKMKKAIKKKNKLIQKGGKAALKSRKRIKINLGNNTVKSKLDVLWRKIVTFHLSSPAFSSLIF